MESMMEAIERLYRRMLMAIGRGRVTLVDDTGPVQLLQIRLGADEVRDGMPRLAEYGFTSNPPASSDAVAIFITGDRSNGVVIATGNQAARLKGLAPGEVGIYDDLGQIVYLTRAGIVIQSSLNITVKAAQKLRLEGDTVEIVAHTQLRKDVHGYADEFKWIGGTTWQSTTWYTGATVNSITFAIDPPEHFT